MANMVIPCETKGLNTSANSCVPENASETYPLMKVDILSSVELNIVLYSIIFLLSVGGNVLVILLMVRNPKMRTATNMFLLNLVISDLLLSVLCMPFTLVATILLRDFIFGLPMCIVIRYFQAVSVGVSCYTLVAISLERYHAICEPLKSRSRQTWSHTRRMIVGVWLCSLVVMLPIAVFHRLIRIRTGTHACREVWPPLLLEYRIDVGYSIFLAVYLLLVPLMLMSVFYGLVGKQLWISSINVQKDGHSHSGNPADCEPLSAVRHAREIASRKRVIRMLVVVVLQYFVCWTPIYVLNTWQAVDFMSVYRNISPTVKSLVSLLAYTSSFIHPITYCLLNKSFRQGMAQCFRRKKPNRSFFTSSLS